MSENESVSVFVQVHLWATLNSVAQINAVASGHSL